MDLKITFFPKRFDFVAELHKQASLKNQGKYPQLKISLPKEWIGRVAVFVRCTEDNVLKKGVRKIDTDDYEVKEVKIYTSGNKYETGFVYLPVSWGDCEVDCYLLKELRD